MKLTRLDLDGVASPSTIAARIHELEPDLPMALPIGDLCSKLDIATIEEIETSAFEAALIMD